MAQIFAPLTGLRCHANGLIFQHVNANAGTFIFLQYETSGVI